MKRFLKYLRYVFIPYDLIYIIIKLRIQNKKSFNNFIDDIAEHKILFDVLKSHGFVVAKAKMSINVLFSVPLDMVAALDDQDKGLFVTTYVLDNVIMPVTKVIEQCRSIDLVSLDHKVIEDKVLISIVPSTLKAYIDLRNILIALLPYIIVAYIIICTLICLVVL